LIRSIEIVLVRGASVRPIAPAPCVASKFGEPCGARTVHAFSLPSGLTPCCLRDIAQASKRGGLAIVNGGASC
jgi:hypothetical protein